MENQLFWFVFDYGNGIDFMTVLLGPCLGLSRQLCGNNSRKYVAFCCVV